MPELPTYNQQVQGGRGLQIQAPIRAIESNAVNNVINAVGQAATIGARQQALIEKQEQEQATAWAMQEAAERQVQETMILKDMEANAPAGAPDFFPSVQKRINEFRGNRANQITKNPDIQRYYNHPAAQEYLNLTTAKRDQTITAQSLSFQAQKHAQHKKNLINNGVALYANQAFTNPDQTFDLIDDAMLGIQNAKLDATDAGEMAMEQRFKIGRAGMEGLIAQDPKRALDVLKSGQFQEVLNPNDLGVLTRNAERAISKKGKEGAAFARRLISNINDGVRVSAADVDQGIEGALMADDQYLAEDLAQEKLVLDYGEEVRAMSLAQRQAEYQELISRPDAYSTPLNVAKIKKLEKLQQEAITQGKKDPLTQGLKDGVLKDLPTVFDQDGLLTEQGIVERIPDAVELAERYNTNIKVFQPEEVYQYRKNFEKLNNDQQTQQVFLVHQQTKNDPVARQAVINQLFEGNVVDTLSLATAVAGDDLNLARSIIQGNLAIKNKVVEMPANNEILAEFNKKYGDIFGNAEQRKGLIAVVKAKMAEQALSENLDKNDISRIAEDVMEDVIGKPIKTADTTSIFNDGKRTISFKIDNDNYASDREWKRIFKNLSKQQQDKVIPTSFPEPYAGGKPVDIFEVYKHATFEPIRNGKYLARVGDGYIMDGAGENAKEYIFDMPKLRGLTTRVK